MYAMARDTGTHSFCPRVCVQVQLVQRRWLRCMQGLWMDEGPCTSEVGCRTGGPSYAEHLLNSPGLHPHVDPGFVTEQAMDVSAWTAERQGWLAGWLAGRQVGSSALLHHTCRACILQANRHAATSANQHGQVLRYQISQPAFSGCYFVSSDSIAAHVVTRQPRICPPQAHLHCSYCVPACPHVSEGR